MRKYVDRDRWLKAEDQKYQELHEIKPLKVARHFSEHERPPDVHPLHQYHLL
ncbi:MAG: hypothetical protein M3Z26_16315 [Bacteroidota bacterium]|nr:hypothetical protein [Bacteroidota bacterium]